MPLKVFVHYFSSPKGGVGKTILAYCLLRKLLQLQGKNIIGVFDINDNDQDFYDLLHGNRTEVNRNLHSPFFVYDDNHPLRRPFKCVDGVDDFPVFLYKVDNDDMTIGTVNHLWECIAAVILDLKFKLIQQRWDLTREMVNIHLIIDSNKNVLTLLPTSAGPRFEQQRSIISEIISELLHGISQNRRTIAEDSLIDLRDPKQHELLLNTWTTGIDKLTLFPWFLWTAKSVLKTANSPYYITRLRNLSEKLSQLVQRPGFNCTFIHVINPSAFFPNGTPPAADSNHNLLFRLGQFLGLPERPVQNRDPHPIEDLVQLYSILFKNNTNKHFLEMTDFTAFIRHAYNSVNPDRNLSSFFIKLSSRIDRPYNNIIVIPYYYYGLEAFVDKTYIDIDQSNTKPDANYLHQADAMVSRNYQGDYPSIDEIVSQFYDRLELS